MTAGAHDGVVERELRIAARPEIVFGLLTDPEQIIRWHGIAVEADARPGGVYRVHSNELGHVEEGQFLEVVPFTRLVYSWGWAPGPFDVAAGSTTVTFTLTPEGDGTRLHLMHTGLPSAVPITMAHGAGWDHYLARMVLVAEGQEVPVDPWRTGNMGA